MPIEKRPANPLPKGARAGSRQQHHVADGETLESIASKYHVPLRNLLLHNFATLNPAEINWYLREHVGCTLPTADGMNWRFSSKAHPGLIFLPDTLMRTAAIDMVGHGGAVPRLGGPAPAIVAPSGKIGHEFKYPPNGPRDIGGVLVQVSFEIEFEIRQEEGLIRTTIGKDEIKLAIEAKLSERTNATFSLKIDRKAIIRAFKSRSLADLRKAIKPFEVSVASTYRWRRIDVIPEIGVEFPSPTPLFVAVTGEYDDDFRILGCRFHGKFAAIIGLHVGLSPEGWSVLGGILGTFVLISLTAWLTKRAQGHGALSGEVAWFVNGFIAKVYPDHWSAPSGTEIENALFEQGQLDAVLEARRVLRELGDEAMSGNDAVALAAYRRYLRIANDDKDEHAIAHLSTALQAKTCQLVGL